LSEQYDLLLEQNNILRGTR